MYILHRTKTKTHNYILQSLKLNTKNHAIGFHIFTYPAKLIILYNIFTY